ncbi:MAG: hypothetical protein NTW80_11280 [Deltaproteobacteria bacterium]|nr:hypothetical protein [Deltaproteobacteria bacterium]
MFILLMGVLVGIFLGVLMISLSSLAQEGEEDKVVTEIVIFAAADSYYGATPGVIGRVNQAAQYLQ